LQLSKSSIYSTKPFKSIADEAEQASLQVLARHTVASALEEVKKADTSGCDPVPELIAKYKEAH
ncbi:hypothetical protein AAH248_005783, partial [Klebsiella michiganensis]